MKTQACSTKALVSAGMLALASFGGCERSTPSSASLEPTSERTTGGPVLVEGDSREQMSNLPGITIESAIAQSAELIGNAVRIELNGRELSGGFAEPVKGAGWSPRPGAIANYNMAGVDGLLMRSAFAIGDGNFTPTELSGTFRRDSTGVVYFEVTGVLGKDNFQGGA